MKCLMEIINVLAKHHNFINSMFELNQFNYLHEACFSYLILLMMEKKNSFYD